MAASAMMHETVWLDQHKVEAEEANYYKKQYGTGGGDSASCKQYADQVHTTTSALKQQIAQARQEIQQTLSKSKSPAAAGDEGDGSVVRRIDCLEQKYDEIIRLLKKLESRCDSFEGRLSAVLGVENQVSVSTTSGTSATKPVQNGKKAEESDDDIDLFGSESEEEDEEAERVKQERLKAYLEKKGKKPGVVAKSNIIMDVKPWDDETDMAELERAVRTITADGLVWGASKLVPLAYGIKKLQISAVVEDEKISTDWLEEEITGKEDFVQSMDIAAFNKI